MQPASWKRAYIFYGLISLVFAYLINAIADRYQVLRVATLYLGSDTLEQCIAESGVVQRNGHAFAICRSWSTNGGEFIHAIVYDASEQIVLNADSNSISWQESIRACEIGSKTNLFCHSHFQTRPILNHLFVVQFFH